MFALVVSACLASQPQTCIQDVVGWSPSPLPESCAALVDTAMPLWARAHPNYRIQSTWCQPGHSRNAAAQSQNVRIKWAAECPPHSRPAVMAWVHQNPGKSYSKACRRQDTP